MKQYPGVIAFLILSMLAIFSAVPSALCQPADPDRIIVVHGKPFVEGEFYLDSAADTAALKQVGVRRFEFRGHAVNSVRYGALVPLGADLRHLPAHVTWLTDDTEPALDDDMQEYYGHPAWDHQYNTGFAYYYNVNRNTEWSSRDEWQRNPDPQYNRRGGHYGPVGCQPSFDGNDGYYYPDFGYRSYWNSGYGCRRGRIGFDGPPTDRPSRRNTYTYDEYCPVFSIPASGTYLLSPGNPVRPVIGTPQPCR